MEYNTGTTNIPIELFVLYNFSYVEPLELAIKCGDLKCENLLLKGNFKISYFIIISSVNKKK